MNEAESLEEMERQVAEVMDLLFRQEREFLRREQDRLRGRYERTIESAQRVTEVHTERVAQIYRRHALRGEARDAERHLSSLPPTARSRLRVMTIRCPAPAGRTCPLVQVYSLPTGTVAQFLTRGGRCRTRIVVDGEGNPGDDASPLATCRHGEAGVKMTWLRQEVAPGSGVQHRAVAADAWRPSA